LKFRESIGSVEPKSVNTRKYEEYARIYLKLLKNLEEITEEIVKLFFINFKRDIER
jgi:hypothetical protein